MPVDIAVCLAVLAFVCGAGLGYFAGHRQGKSDERFERWMRGESPK